MGCAHGGPFDASSCAATKNSPNEPGGRANVFSSYVIIITSTLRFRLRYVTVAGATFSFTLRYRSGREAHRLALKDPGRHFETRWGNIR